MERWTFEESGSKTNSIIQHQLVISKIPPCEGSSSFSIPKELGNPMKVSVDIQNKDNECFR